MESAVYYIPECNLASFEAKIAKLNKRARRVGAQPISPKTSFDSVRFQCMNRDGSDYWLTKDQIDARNAAGRVVRTTGGKMAFFAVTVDAPTPKYDGWVFVASLQSVTTDAGVAQNVIKTAPGMECPLEYSKRVGECDQCKKSRRRNETFVVKHDDGSFKVVGRNCIGDFLGGQDPAMIAARAEWLFSVNEAAESELGCTGGSAPQGEETLRVLAWTVSLIDTLGWRSKASCEYGGTSTASLVMSMLNPYPREPKEITELREQAMVNDDHYTKAQAAMDWAAGLSDSEIDGNSYLQNCRLLAQCAWTNYRNVGIVASIVAAHHRQLDMLKEQARKAARKPSAHVGQIKKRQEMVVTCEKVIKIDGNYGLTGIHRMVDENGNDLVWFASGSAAWLTEGETYTIKATPKEHTEYKGRPQTIVTRVAIISETVTVEKTA